MLTNFLSSSRFLVEEFSSRSSAREPMHPDIGFRSSLFIFRRSNSQLSSAPGSCYLGDHAAGVRDPDDAR
jgi:hypothetical protein